MPKEKDVTRCLPKIYKRNFENLGLFFFVNAQKKIVPTVTVEQAARSYFDFMGIDFDDWDMESVKVTYSRMCAEYIDYKYEATKTDCGYPCTKTVCH